MSTLNLKYLIHTPGTLILSDDLEVSQGHQTEVHIPGPDGWKTVITKYEKPLVIRVSGTKPQKVNRRYEFYVATDRTADSFELFYLLDNQCLWKTSAPITETETGEYLLDLTGFLKNRGIEYEIPAYRRLSFDDKLCMMFGPVSESYGASDYLPERGSAYDGSGSGYIFYLMPGYLTHQGVEIRKLKIHSYSLKPISTKVKEMLGQCPRETEPEELENLLHVMCSGNEIEIATADLDIRISRHYNSGIRLTAFGKKEAFALPRQDVKHSIHPDEQLLEKVENCYAMMLFRLITSRSFEDAIEILEGGLQEIEKL